MTWAIEGNPAEPITWRWHGNGVASTAKPRLLMPSRRGLPLSSTGGDVVKHQSSRVVGAVLETRQYVNLKAHALAANPYDKRPLWLRTSTEVLRESCTLRLLHT